MLWSLYTFTIIKKMLFKIKKLCFRRVFTIYKKWKLLKSIIKTNPNILEALRITWCQQTKAKSLFDIYERFIWPTLILSLSLPQSHTIVLPKNILSIFFFFWVLKVYLHLGLFVQSNIMHFISLFFFTCFSFLSLLFNSAKSCLKKYNAKKVSFFPHFFLLRVCLIRNLLYVWLVKTFWTTWKKQVP